MSEFKILVVEDDQSILRLISTTLKIGRYAFLTAQSGGEAISLCASHNPDLILLDLGLPDMDGLEVISTVRTWSQVPIIVISARDEDRACEDPCGAAEDRLSEQCFPGLFRLPERLSGDRLRCRACVLRGQGTAPYSDRIPHSVPSLTEHRESSDTFAYHRSYMGNRRGVGHCLTPCLHGLPAKKAGTGDSRRADRDARRDRLPDDTEIFRSERAGVIIRSTLLPPQKQAINCFSVWHKKLEETTEGVDY